MNEQKLSGNPALKNIDPAKLQSLLSMAEQARGKNQSELLSFLMAASGSGRMKFSSQEMDAIIGVLKVRLSSSKSSASSTAASLIRRRFPARCSSFTRVCPR